MDREGVRRPRGDRRWFLGLTGAAAAAGGLALAGCGGGRKTTPGASTDEDPADGTRSTGTPGTAGQGTVGPTQRGETLRYTGYVISDGAFDPHKTQAGPFYGQQALVFSRLLAYQDQAAGTIVPDLATAKPEQPDGQTLVFRLNPAARWHEREPLNGRAVTAQDVKFSIDRQALGDPSFVRKADWKNIDSVEASDPTTVTVKLKAPLAMMVPQFADVNAFIVAPELSDGGRQYTVQGQLGSGPFRWVEWVEGQFASVGRNPRWHGGNDRPYLDGITVFQPKDTDAVEAGLRTKKLDVAFVGRPQADRLRKAVPSLQEAGVGQLLFFGMRFFTPQFPYNDVRFRTAVSVGLDRREMVAKFFAGSGDINPWISWPLTRWTLPQSELTNVPGYRAGAGGRDQDIKEAKALLAAFTAEKKLPADPLALLVVEDAERNLKMGSVIKEQLKRNLDLDVAVYSVPTGELVKRLFEANAPWAAGPDMSHIDLDACVYPYFHTEGTQNSFALRDKDLDALIEKQRTELDEKARREIGFDLQRRLLQLNVGLNFVSERIVALSWPYVRNFPLDASDGFQQRFADCWIDRSDASFRGR